nr:hypothetical protein [uncultured Pedobacter sp.]
MEQESYFKKIEYYLTPSAGLKSYLNYSLHERIFKKKQTIEISDEYFSTLAYISTGTLRLYAVKEGKERTILFWQKDQFLPPLFMLGKYIKKEVFVEFLEDAIIIGYPEIHTDNMNKLFRDYRELINKLYQEQISELILHAESLAHLNAKVRFENLMKSKPELFNLCELKIIADYLGIHPKVLSLLRSKAVKR